MIQQRGRIKHILPTTIKNANLTDCQGKDVVISTGQKFKLNRSSLENVNLLTMLSGNCGLLISTPSSAPDLLWSIDMSFGLSLSLFLQLYNGALRLTFQAPHTNSLKGPQ